MFLICIVAKIMFLICIVAKIMFMICIVAKIMFMICIVAKIMFMICIIAQFVECIILIIFHILFNYSSKPGSGAMNQCPTWCKLPIKLILPLFQDEKNQVLTTNVWFSQVSILTIIHSCRKVFLNLKQCTRYI